MKKINISKDFGVYDIGKVREVTDLIGKIKFDAESSVELDLRECLIDYPATGALLDKVLSELDKNHFPKTLKVLYDCDLSEGTLLNWLLLGSKFFNISDKKELGMDELKPIIANVLKEKSMTLQIVTLNDEGQELNAYKYE